MTPLPITAALAALAIGYFLGAIPFGLLFTYLSGGGDVRKIGSGNIGATNVLRTGKKWAAAATLFCDGGKGAAAVLIARHWLPPGAEIFAALAAILGHLYPLWLGFKGGKGVASFLGISLALYWPAGLLVAATWAGGCFCVAHFLAVGADRRRAGAGLFLRLRPARLCAAGGAPGDPDFLHAPGQYPPPVARRGAAYRRGSQRCERLATANAAPGSGWRAPRMSDRSLSRA